MPGKRKKKVELEEPLQLESGGEEPKDIYDEEELEELQEADEITAAEEGFMRGREGDLEGGRKRKKSALHKDTPSVALAKNQYGED